MPKESIKLGVIAISHPPVTRWATRVLRPMAVLPLAPQIAPGTLMRENQGVETWYLGLHDLVLYVGDAGHYKDNLTSRQPSVWVALRDRAQVQMITADPYEGEGLASDPSLVVDAVPMPDVLVAKLTEFVAAHHVEVPFKKRKRTAAVPEADPRAPRILRPEDKWERQ